ncbi:TadE/TadG family type IV pilus assembly protein [Brevundimonas lenta]|uniref:Flp pilus assembly protein TadG n=1 Tax=Brevundimonas lenta TaxID=424796 RepID=A0A7W6JAY2_9CAUL|nr:TadE/TadG family type IV pilus assembly protein [Brevundimonas lenta]MBB4081761.1 Flp pilus assembly protein TadG [Brevundimonas lenta]
MRRSLIRRLASDERGMSAVEFALLAPILIAFYLGMSEFCQGYMAQKRMGHVASMVADLVSQQQTVTKTDVDEIFSIGGLIMKPFTTASLKQRVSSVSMDNKGVVTVNWSRGSGMTALKPGDPVTIPADVITAGESVIMSEATYDYDSPADYLMPKVTHFSHRYFLRPRTVTQIPCTNC